MFKEASLGYGLIGIGRKWGHVQGEVPSENASLRFLSKAYEYGINFFDTAPSYGLSEQRLGKFLQTLTHEELDGIVVATKFGEHWNFETKEPYVDHSYDSLRKSLDQSVTILGRIDILQLHKTNFQVLQSENFNKAVEYARSLGIDTIGASITDLESAGIICSNDDLNVIQFPYNSNNIGFRSVFEWAKNKLVITNRPFAMGALLYEPNQIMDEKQQKISAYQFILRERNNNLVVLTGTKDPNHLYENMQAFNSAHAL